MSKTNTDALVNDADFSVETLENRFEMATAIPTDYTEAQLQEAETTCKIVAESNCASGNEGDAV